MIRVEQSLLSVTEWQSGSEGKISWQNCTNMAKTRSSGNPNNASPKLNSTAQLRNQRPLERNKNVKKANNSAKKKATSPKPKNKGQKLKQPTNGKSVLEKRVKKVFTCPVCLSLPLGKIYQCKEGHLVCMDCFKKLRSPISCPTCRTAMSMDAPMRNRAAEQVKWVQYIIIIFMWYDKYFHICNMIVKSFI